VFHLLDGGMPSREQWVSAVAIVQNVAPAVAITLVNKALFSMAGWPSSSLLALLHLGTNMMVIETMRLAGKFERKAAPWSTVLAISAPLAVTQGLMALSLKVNTIGDMVILKQQTIIFTAVAECILGKRDWSLLLGLVICGVIGGMVQIYAWQPSLNVLGVMIATMASLLNSSGQLLLSHHLGSGNFTPLQLRYETTVRGGWMVGFTTLFELALYGTGTIFSVDSYRARQLPLLLLSCALAPAVSLTYYFVVSSCSPLTYQLLGPLKVLLTLATSLLFFSEPLSPDRAVGCAVILLSLTIYALFCTRKKPIKEDLPYPYSNPKVIPD